MKIYTLKTCDSCRKATKWLAAKGISYEEIAIREQSPSIAELQMALNQHQGDVRKLFNQSGADYRLNNLKDLLPSIHTSEALQLLCANGNLIKRPFLVTHSSAITGFNPDVWSLLFD